MKVIFMDIDGCLSRFGGDSHNEYVGKDLAIDIENLSNFKSIVDRVPDVKIVWSTSWRFYDDQIWNGKWRNPRLYVESLPWMAGRVAGITPKKMSSERFHEVKWWLDAHKEVTDYVVIDDSYFPKDWFGIEKHLVHCDRSAGLTAEGADTAVSILGGAA